VNAEGVEWLFIDTLPLYIDLIVNAVVRTSAVIIPLSAPRRWPPQVSERRWSPRGCGFETGPHAHILQRLMHRTAFAPRALPGHGMTRHSASPMFGWGRVGWTARHRPSREFDLRSAPRGVRTASMGRMPDGEDVRRRLNATLRRMASHLDCRVGS
jgi:hypothetical protein